MAVGIERPIELTAKRFKLISLFAVLLMVVGCIAVFFGGPNAMPLGGLVTALGLCVYIVNRVRIWWHHD